MGYPAAHDCLEAGQLKLSKEKIPLGVSLQELVMRRFADSGGSSLQQPMEWEELLGYIRAIDNLDGDPLGAILAQTEVIGDPALPKPGERAALRWVGAAFDAWEQSFPLDVELKGPLRAMKPVLARAALSDATFFQPGHHPLHLVLDALHDSAVGWQPDLGRAGEPVRTLLETTVAACRDWLDDGNTRLREVAADLADATRRGRARADRMALRAVETERGKVRSAQARAGAANMINEAMAQYPVPQDIGRILRGPWYDSAQLVLLKFGEDSAEWREMSAATLSLVSSMKPAGPGDEAGKRELLSRIARVPTELRRWLLSLQHEGETLEQILTTVEYAQLRSMRGQPAEAVDTATIPVDGAFDGEAGETPTAQRQGQWFLISPRGGDAMRAQLAMAQGGQLLFCNLAGIKVLALGQDQFADMLEDGSATPLPAGASFSRALVAAAGIDSDEKLASLLGDAEASETPAPEPAGEPAAAQDVAPSTGSNQPTQPDPGRAPATELTEPTRVELPMGTWLGFHDIDPPLLAKLALHDKVRGLLIFVNRKGVELRRLEEAQYFELIARGEVDILEAKNNFREQVERARARLQRHHS